jgi:2-polyprenyl-6-methoxyphenol hydroxylase-like FAD-dependent oxidoreductase
MRAVQVVGGGPAGATAALAALREGTAVRIFEKSEFPRHKVCGEFLSPAILALLRRIGCEQEFLHLRPAILREMQLHFGPRVIRHPLPEHAYGLSRYELDNLLLQCAARAGAHVVREHWSAAAQESTMIIAAGRKSIAPLTVTAYSASRRTSGAHSMTPWNCSSSKTAMSASAPLKPAQRTSAASPLSEHSVRSASIPAHSSFAPARYLIACAH